ncbi:MAG: methylmalonyl-CoA mutase family protein [Gammaproteobacteria bacterium]|nr:methylmalonyl-CoA mutase family protein [Gammaproteobacteria bacterium]
MSDEKLDLASEFPDVTFEAWKALAEQSLKGKTFESALVSKTYDDIEIQPLYTTDNASNDPQATGLPGLYPFTRGSQALGKTEVGWGVRQSYAHPDIQQSNDTLLTELERGCTSLLLQLDAMAEGCEKAGIFAYSLTDLDTLLKGVFLELAPVALSANQNTLGQAAVLLALWKKRGHNADDVRGNLGADPLGVLAAKGSLLTSISTALSQVADLAAYTSTVFPEVRSVVVDSSVYHAAGASEAQDLACSMATAVTYLRAMTEAGMDVNAACQQISFSYETDTDFFLSIAKLRAARRLWSRIAEVSGADESSAAMQMHVTTAYRMYSQRDPWVNILRATIASFAGAVAGADSITVRPFDQAMGLPSEFSRRVARNIQIILQEESGLAKVIDPAGGSLYVETVSHQLAEQAWEKFQTIEAAGGMAKALETGLIQDMIASVQTARASNIARRIDAVTGINEFPNIQEPSIDVETPDFAQLHRSALSRSAGQADAALVDAIKANRDKTNGELTASVVSAVELGADMKTIADVLQGKPAQITALAPHRLAEAFEELRDASDAWLAKTGQRPAILLVNMGTAADYTARMTFAKNYFEAGGIEGVVSADSLNPEAAVEACRKAGLKHAILCSSDAFYSEQAEVFAKALKSNGVEYLYLAGKPGEHESRYREAGIDHFVFAGDQTLETLQIALKNMGVLN